MPAILVGFATAMLAVALWGWDAVHDPTTVAASLPRRLLMGGLLALYPVAMLAKVKRPALP